MKRRIINAIHSFMTHTARTNEDFVYYPEVIRMAGIGHLGSGALEGSLGNTFFDINAYDWEQDSERPMLSAIAVSSQSGYPSGGFYRLARDKGKLTSKKELDEIEFWLKELATLREYWQSLSDTTFKSMTVTYQSIYDTLLDFDEEFPDSGDYDQWLDKGGYKYAVEFGGRVYPPKHILSKTTGISTSEFSGGDQTNRIFQQLGFVVIDKPGFVAESTTKVANTYLLTWNHKHFAWDSFQEDYDAFYMGSRPRLRWSCGNTKRIQIGDRVFLMRLGHQDPVKGILASGIVTKGHFEHAHWSDESGNRTANYIEFEPDILLNSEYDELLDPNLVTQDFDWFPQSSGISIPSDTASYLERVWQRHVDLKNVEDIDNTISPPYREGSRTRVSSYRYERDPNARSACITHYGAHCAVCEFDFSEIFGVIGDGFIHVHHLVPISDHNEEYAIDPIEDLRPVCPNCHAMLHRKSPPYSIEELQYIRQSNS